MFKRFSPEEANPADESEAEYSSGLDDEDLDVDAPGAYLDDEPSSGRRNHLEDVYPELTEAPPVRVR